VIINYSVENWRSFRDKASFTMLATSEQQHGERVPAVKKYRTRVLPSAVIYGGNASGKTNLFQAIMFMKNMVLEGTGVEPDKLIDVEPFRLDAAQLDMPCRFLIELLVDEIIYEYAFAVTKRAVIEEKLTKITSSSERVLFNRKGDKPNLDPSLAKNEALKYAFQGTRDNQLFLTNTVSQKIETFLPIRNWFKESLVLVAPDSRFSHYNYFIDADNPLYEEMSRILPLLDTGVFGLGGKELSFEQLPIPAEIKKDIQEKVKEHEAILVSLASDNLWFEVSRKKGVLVARKMVTKHRDVSGNEVDFEMQIESDGSRRVIDLLPAFLDISTQGSKKVYFVDELDRSLHTLLSRKMIEFYLASCSKSSRAQLILSTHDLLLMDQDIFRRDEMWVTESNKDGSSSLFSFSEYKDLRYDKDLLKSYLQGRLGGIPKILLKDRVSGCLEVN
jgi:uncharacterized protein